VFVCNDDIWASIDCHFLSSVSSSLFDMFESIFASVSLFFCLEEQDVVFLFKV
jgi:hypothetical protein